MRIELWDRPAVRDLSEFRSSPFHRMSKKVAAHATSELGISPAISAGADFIEHGCHASDSRRQKGSPGLVKSRLLNRRHQINAVYQTDDAPQHLQLFVGMQDLLRYIDLDYYRSAQVLIVRAEIAQLRRQSSTVARAEQPRKTPNETLLPLDAFDQTV
jgi:hypothetical protein